MAGSIHEGELLGAGLSHCLEHMLFKGTSTRGAGRIDQEVQAAGGYMNAYTSFDRTVYWIDVPSAGAAVAIDILCDIMQHASLPADELEKEKQVILREMDMNQDDPARRASRRLFETAYTRSPQRFTVIGYPDIFKAISRQQLVDYYRSHYAPQNVFFVVVGDIDSEVVFKQITEAYSATKAVPMAPIVLPEEPCQTAPRAVIEEAPVELGHFHISWHVPGIRHPDTPALDVLATLLGHGRSSRLYREIRQKKQLAHSADAWTYSPGGAGLFGMSATIDADKFQAAQEAMLDEVERAKTELIGEEELRKVVKQFISGTISSRKTMQGQAQDLGGNWLATQDLNFSERLLAAVKKVTPVDIQRVARDHLTPENRTLYALLPTGSKPTTAEVESRRQSNPVEKVTLDNGLRILLKEDRRLPFVQLRAAFNGGVLAEPADQSGITQLLAKLLLQGTANRSAEQIADEIESIGGAISASGGNNSLSLSAEVLNEDLETGLTLAADVLFRPAFPTEALERERQIQLAGIRAQKDQMLQRAMISMRRELYGDASYGPDASGSQESVSQLSQQNLRDFHKCLIAPDNCVLAVFGDFDRAHLLESVETAFADWPAVHASFAAPRLPEPISEARRVSETLNKKQAVVVIGYPGATFDSEDRFALDLIQEACSDLGSRLFMRIRDELGLAYYVGARHMPGKIPGYFAFYTGTEPAQVELVEKELLAEAAKLASEGLSEEELARCKSKIVGHKKIARHDLGSHAIACALDELYGLGFDRSDKDDERYEAVTVENIKEIAGNYLSPEKMVVSIVRGADEEKG